jgi:hypothetical protein
MWSGSSFSCGAGRVFNWSGSSFQLELYIEFQLEIGADHFYSEFYFNLPICVLYFYRWQSARLSRCVFTPWL